VRGRLTLEDLWLCLPVLGLLIILDLSLVRPYDFWWHLAAGQIVAESGAIPAVDPFSFTRGGQPWTDQAWLAQVILYALYRPKASLGLLSGLPLVIFVHALAVTAGYTLVMLAALRAADGQSRPASLATLLAAAVSVFNWNVRPQTASFLLFGAVVWALETHRTGRGWAMWVLPPVFALWANLHGGFMFGALLVGIYVVTRLVEDLAGARRVAAATAQALAAATVSALALVLTPFGLLGSVRYILGLGQSRAVQDFVLEWMPLSVRTLDGQIFLVVVILLLALAYIRRPAMPAYLPVALVIFASLSLYTRRAEPWFGMVAAPAFALLLAPARRSGSSTTPEDARSAANSQAAARPPHQDDSAVADAAAGASLPPGLSARTGWLRYAGQGAQPPGGTASEKQVGWNRGFSQFGGRRQKPAEPTRRLRTASRPERWAIFRTAGPAGQRDKPALNYAVLGLLLLLAFASLPWLRLAMPFPPHWRSYIALAETPIAATERLCALDDDIRVFNDMGYGSYLIWACPRVPVFIDTRIEVYPSAMWREYFLVSDGQFGWEAALARHNVNAILANKERQRMLTLAAKASNAWKVVYEDAHSALLLRSEP